MTNSKALWTPEEYVFYVNDREVWRTRAGGVSQVPRFTKLTEEIDKWGGDITQAELPGFFEVPSYPWRRTAKLVGNRS